MTVETVPTITTTPQRTNQRSATFLLSRHAEPREWGVIDSPITDEGRRQEEIYARDVAHRLRFTEGKVLVVGRYSEVLRVAISASIFDQVLKAEIKRGGLEHLTYLGFQPSRILQATDTLAPIFNANTRVVNVKNEAFPFWMTAPEEILRQLGSTPPSEVDRKVTALIRGSINRFMEDKSFDKGLFPFLGHETTLGGPLAIRMENPPLFVPCSGAGEMILTAREDEDIEAEFGGVPFNYNI